MKLEYIKENECPICGCDLIKEKSVELERLTEKPKYRQHTNGGRWEHRTFACGQIISYCPNFLRVKIDEYNKCTKSEEYKIQKQRRNDFLNLIKNYIKCSGEVDKPFRDKLLSCINISI